MSPGLSICLLVLATLGHGYLWTDPVNYVHSWSGPRKLVDALSWACFAAFLVLPLALLWHWNRVGLFGGSPPDGFAKLLQYYLCFCFAWGFVHLIRIVAYTRATDRPQVLVDWQQQRIDVPFEDPNELLREGLPQLLAKVPFNQILQPTVDRKRLAIPRLNSKLVGLKIAHISDLHMVNRIEQPWFEFICDQVNQLKPDVTCITGDIVEKETCWPWLATSLGKLHAPLGVYFIIGNHDFYIDTSYTKQLLEQQGLVCLSERWIATKWNGAPVQIAGNELPWSEQAADLGNAPATTDLGEPFRLALMHAPDQLPWACQHQVDLALAGHTHGGQLRFPLLGPIISPSCYGTRYASGVFKHVQTVMHVTRGVTGKTPLRWNCPPEIALLELAGS